MIVGVPTETKPGETRTAVTPSLVAALCRVGHDVQVQGGVGAASGFSDADYARAGARILESADAIWGAADIIVKVKEPFGDELTQVRDGQIVFSFLHLAAAPECLAGLVESGCVAIGFETVQQADGSLPLLAPMSEIAGLLGVQMGAHLLTAPQGGKGVLLGGAAGVRPATVVVIGVGTVGIQAISLAVGMQAQVIAIDRDPNRLRHIAELHPSQVATLVESDRLDVDEAIAGADLAICAALVVGSRAPTVISEELLGRMEPGSVVMDIAIDQGGNCEASRPTTHDDPTIESHGVLVSAITNMPAAVPRTATAALSAAIGPYLIELADLGWRGAAERDPALGAGINVAHGRVVHPALLASIAPEEPRRP